MGKYFATDFEAKQWAASKLQAIVRSRNERRAVAHRRADMEEAAKLLVDPNNVKILDQRQAADGFEEDQLYIKSRKFKEDAGDGDISSLRHWLKQKKGSVDPNMPGYRNERAGHRAAENGHEDCLKLCIENGFDQDCATKLGNTAAHYAAMGGANGCIRLLSDNLADIMKSNLKDETPVTISASKGKESTMALINSLAVQGEDLAMKRRRYNELRRQNEIRRKKGILFGRDIDGGEGGNEFVVPFNARLNEENKFFVSCGLRSSGTVKSVLSAGIAASAPIVFQRRKAQEADRAKREGVRSLMFLSNERKNSASTIASK
ncbi:hypothetical protein TrST_g6235 [Triparma strigata]|uniref:Uncharacterized protein n=1 Tax=Triparma strigata TaxID=1606541 RepID=A0A9W7BER3_9STRA|nr:hypothetical protein TrST_g6235 [Triparma strigata]